MTSVKTTIRSIAWMVLQFVLAVQSLLAQCESKAGFARKACEVEAAGASGNVGTSPSLISSLKAAPLSTGYSDTIHLDTLSPSIEANAFRPLTKLDRTDDGAFLLKAGIFEAFMQSYSLDPGERGPARAGGFFPAPIKGRRAKVIADALKQTELHPDVPQGEIQQLLWALVQGTDLERMPAQVQQTAARILPRKSLALIKGATVARVVEKEVLGIVNRRLSQNPSVVREEAGTVAKAEEIDRTYGVSRTAQELKEATAPPAFASADEVVLRGTWAQMPGGFYVRYLPEGYAKLRLQVIVPDVAIAKADPSKPLSFDPTQYLAVFAGAPAQRLGVTLRPAK